MDNEILIMAYQRRNPKDTRWWCEDCRKFIVGTHGDKLKHEGTDKHMRNSSKRMEIDRFKKKQKEGKGYEIAREHSGKKKDPQSFNPRDYESDIVHHGVRGDYMDISNQNHKSIGQRDWNYYDEGRIFSQRAQFEALMQARKDQEESGEYSEGSGEDEGVKKDKPEVKIEAESQLGVTGEGEGEGEGEIETYVDWKKSLEDLPEVINGKNIKQGTIGEWEEVVDPNEIYNEYYRPVSPEVENSEQKPKVENNQVYYDDNVEPEDTKLIFKVTYGDEENNEKSEEDQELDIRGDKEKEIVESTLSLIETHEEPLTFKKRKIVGEKKGGKRKKQRTE